MELDDEELFAYLVACRDAGMAEDATLATWVLLAGGMDDIQAKLEVKLPRDVAEAKVTLVIERMVSQAFRGSSPGEFYALRNRVIHGVGVDFWRGPEGRQLEQDREGARLVRDDDDNLPEPSADDPGYEHVEKFEIIDGVLASRSETHRRAIELFLFADLPAREVAERTGLTEANVNQIVKRFREDCG